jgi:hypothetical protein
VAGASQSGYTPNRTETSQTGSGNGEPFQNNGTQSDQTGNGLNNQSGTGTQSGINDQSEPMDTNEVIFMN